MTVMILSPRPPWKAGAGGGAMIIIDLNLTPEKAMVAHKPGKGPDLRDRDRADLAICSL